MGAAIKHWEMLNCLTMAIRRDMPSFSLIVKEKHWLFKLLLRINPDFQRQVTVTIYPWVFMPKEIHDDPRLAWKVLAHEYVHLSQARKNVIPFFVRYAFPQILSVFAVGASFSSLYFLLALLFLLPIPAYYRMQYEIQGYIMSMAVNYWRYGFVHNDQKDFIKRVFSSSTYYYMWPFKRWIDRKINTESVNVERGYYDDSPVFSTVRILIENVWSPK